MTKAELLLDAIGEAQDYYIEELNERLDAPKKRKRWKTPLIVAACIVLVSVTAVFSVRFFFSLFGAGGGRCNYAEEGICAGGYFYYEAQNDGIYRYTPGEGSQRIVGNRSLWNDCWYSFTANDDALYYAKGNTIYRVAHDSTASQTLYRAEETAEIGELHPAGAHDVTAYIYDNNVGINEKKIIIDGATGEIKSTIMGQQIAEENLLDLDPDSSDFYEQQQELFDNSSTYAGKVSYTVGEYTYDIIRENDGLEGYSYGLYRNGIRLLDRNDHVEPYNARPSGECLILTLGRNGQGFITSPAFFLLIRPDGTVSKVHSGYRVDPQGNGDYFYYISGGANEEGDIIVVNAEDDTQSVLLTAEELRQYGIFTSYDEENTDDFDVFLVYELYSDGEYLYFCDGFDKIACLSIVYDDGIPIGVTLVDDDITE